MRMPTVFESVPALSAMLVFLVIYAVWVVWLFRMQKYGQRRRWHALDSIWVPLGALTGILLVVLWWHMR